MGNISHLVIDGARKHISCVNILSSSRDDSAIKARHVIIGTLLTASSSKEANCDKGSKCHFSRSGKDKSANGRKKQETQV